MKLFDPNYVPKKLLYAQTETLKRSMNVPNMFLQKVSRTFKIVKKDSTKQKKSIT